ncbi:hypothetical protein APSETT445_005962 [Aspergillus pseudonomiae]
MSTREIAKQAVEAIAAKLGYVDSAVLNRIGTVLLEERRIIEQSLGAKDENMGHSIKTSNARFVFELLQNADDNRFTRARERNELPFISFRVYPDRIIVECNEDGFRTEDLSAICSVGESSKAASHGYIGAKGIGFKSVFMAAWKVHIQSGNFSFHFKHRIGDLGLGMVLPNLKQIGIFFYDGSGEMQRSKTFRIHHAAPGHSVFVRASVVDGDGNSTTAEQRYHVTRHTVTGLPTSDSRNIPGTQESGTTFSGSRGCLGVSTYSGFKALAGETGDICLFTSPRVEVQTFVKAVLEFCEDPELCYMWPSFLPLLEDDIGTFWSPLAELIRDLISVIPVWRSRHGNGLRTMSSIVMLPYDFMDSDGNLLLDDSILDPFVSTAYPVALEETLEEYGLGMGTFELVLRMLESDLESPTSRVKSHVTRADFHSRLSQLLLRIENDDGDEMRTLRNLAILPLRNGEWVSANSGQEEIYLPSNHPFGPEALLGQTEYAQGVEVLLMHSTYLEDIPTRPHSNHPSWRMWLTSSLGIRERLSLVSDDSDSLSDSWTYVADCRPGKLLGLLEYLWKYQRSELRQNADLIMEIQSTNATRLCNVDLPDDCHLDETYLPLSNLQALCQRFMEKDEPIPFLYLGEGHPDEEIYSKWTFLHNDFSVGKDDNVDFLLDILYWIQSSNPDETSLTSYERLWDLYIAIDAKHLASKDREAAWTSIEDFFEYGDYIFVPELQEDDSYDAAWAGLENCLWDAPPNMMSKYSLKYVFEQIVNESQLEHLSRFFRHTLSIPNASWSDLTGELVERSQNHCVDFDQIFDMYRREFEDESLIFVTTNGEPGWYKISECLWSSTTDIRGKVTLNDHYEDLKDFFIDTLGVNTLTLEMVYDELLETGSESTIDETKSKIWSLNALLQTEGYYANPDPLLERVVFPVIYPDGTKGLTSAATEFAIPDREHLASQFRGRIKMLDYSLEEVRRLKSFFEWTNLTHRYLSASVKELTSFSGDTAQLISTPRRDLRRKAHAILRKLHISEAPSGLTVYVPKDKKAQEICFCDLFPKQLIDWIMRDPATQIPNNIERDAVTVVSMILNIDPSAIDLVLERQGIIEIDLQNDDPCIDDDSTDDNMPSQRSQSQDQSAGEVPLDPPDILIPFTHQNRRLSNNDLVDVMFRQTQMANYWPNPDPPPMYSPREHTSEDTMQYRTLLNGVLLAARRATFPASGPFNMGELNEALSGQQTFQRYVGFDGIDITDAFRSDSQLERDKKIGAAGELYVFELFTRLDPALTGWSEQNWQSKIRRYVTVHPDYSNMEPYYGRETADITYDDTEGGFTALLIDHGYLATEEWRDKRPKYYIEVKTTTGPLRTPFYMSKHQYERLQDYKRPGIALLNTHYLDWTTL